MEDPNTGVWARAKSAIMTDEGVNAFVGTIVAPRIGKNMILSNLTDEDVSNIVAHSKKDAVFLYVKKKADFKIDAAYRDLIISLVGDTIKLAGKRAVAGLERKGIQQAEKIVQTTVTPHGGQNNNRGGNWLWWKRS